MRSDLAALRRVPAAPEPARPARPPVRLVPARLPGPIRGTRRRKEIVLRPARPQDAAACATLDGRFTTTHIWQLDTRQDGDELRVSFRQLRLPRELALDTPHNPPAARAGALPRGLCWLVAEEVEVTPDAATAGSKSGPPAVPLGHTDSPLDVVPWHHAVRRSGSTSSVQLGFPAPPAPQPAFPPSGVQPARSDAPATVIGYVVVAASNRSAYLRTLVIDRKHRRKGVAARLLAAAQRWAAGQGAEGLMADVPARNYPALRLLQKAGFTFCGFNDRCYPDGEVAVFFSCRLP